MCHTIFGIEKWRHLKTLQGDGLIILKFSGGVFLDSTFIKNCMYDVRKTSFRRQNDDTPKYLKICVWKLLWRNFHVTFLFKTSENLHINSSYKLLCLYKIWFSLSKGEQSTRRAESTPVCARFLNPGLDGIKSGLWKRFIQISIQIWS